MLEVGQKLWFVSSVARHPVDRARGYEVTVKAIGRKWATLTGVSDRLEIATMLMEQTQHGYGRAGSVYLSEADYLKERERQIAWDALRTAVGGRNRPTQEVQTHHILEARKLLGFPPAEGR